MMSASHRPSRLSATACSTIAYVSFVLLILGALSACVTNPPRRPLALTHGGKPVLPAQTGITLAHARVLSPQPFNVLLVGNLKPLFQQYIVEGDGLGKV